MEELLKVTSCVHYTKIHSTSMHPLVIQVPSYFARLATVIKLRQNQAISTHLGGKYKEAPLIIDWKQFRGYAKSAKIPDESEVVKGAQFLHHVGIVYAFLSFSLFFSYLLKKEDLVDQDTVILMKPQLMVLILDE